MKIVSEIRKFCTPASLSTFPYCNGTITFSKYRELQARAGSMECATVLFFMVRVCTLLLDTFCKALQNWGESLSWFVFLSSSCSLLMGVMMIGAGQPKQKISTIHKNSQL